MPKPIKSEPKRLHMHVVGAVQGVGFRPFVYGLAVELNLSGWVRNDIRGLDIEIEGSQNQLDEFAKRLQTAPPRIAEIKGIETNILQPLGKSEFRIIASENQEDVQPRPSVLPDLASCPECIKEAFDPSNRRYRYPFSSCTLCGPRWSLIQALPYDRPNTTMVDFPLCEECEKEYRDPADRRFHHQTNTCPVCGPQLELLDKESKVVASRNEALIQAVDALTQGKIVALKGIGGFQLLVDAGNESAVVELRQRKQRPSKPFAIMCADIGSVAKHCDIEEVEHKLLHSIQAPIVLVRRKKEDMDVAASIAPGNPYLGVMLPYSILHHLLLKEFSGPLVCTSGNLSGEPICKENDEALERLQYIADLFLVHDRPVARALDDSVAQIVLGEISLLRRARGYAPKPIEIRTKKSTNAILAVGAHIKNTVALSLPAEDGACEIMLSAHLGDLDELNTRDAFERRIQNYQNLYRLKPTLAVHDLHPDYYSSQYAQKLNTEKLTVQHHWAHIAACVGEHQIDEPVLAVTWDGVGLGNDHSAWGGEFLVADVHGYERVGQLMPFPLLGGDKAAKDIRRALLGALYIALDGNTDQLIKKLPAGLFSEAELTNLVLMLQREINVTETSSVGRLFDAVSSLLDLCQSNCFEGEGAMALQFAAEKAANVVALDLPQPQCDGRTIIDWRPLLRRLLQGKQQGEPINNLARLFHQTLVKVIVDFVVKMPARAVVLTGGCFQNRLLLTLAVTALRERDVKVYWPQQIPANDGGIAFGQAVIGVNYLLEGQPRNPLKDTETN